MRGITELGCFVSGCFRSHLGGGRRLSFLERKLSRVSVPGGTGAGSHAAFHESFRGWSSKRTLPSGAMRATNVDVSATRSFVPSFAALSLNLGASSLPSRYCLGSDNSGSGGRVAVSMPASAAAAAVVFDSEQQLPPNTHQHRTRRRCTRRRQGGHATRRCDLRESIASVATTRRRPGRRSSRRTWLSRWAW